MQLISTASAYKGNLFWHLRKDYELYSEMSESTIFGSLIKVIARRSATQDFGYKSDSGEDLLFDIPMVRLTRVSLAENMIVLFCRFRWPIPKI